MKSGEYYVYILTSFRNGTLYIGATNDLMRGVYQHTSGAAEGFAKRYSAHRLVYFERTERITAAIMREKQLKAGSRKKKLALIEGVNSHWADLYETLR